MEYANREDQNKKRPQQTDKNIQAKTAQRLASGELSLKNDGPAPGSRMNKSSLPGGVMQKMENSFGTSFSDVNVHKDSSEATNLGAKAFAQGNDVHFAPGQYNPETKSGQELIGHELTHVVQQRQGRVHPTIQGKGMAINDNSQLEQEADVMGKKAAEGKEANVSGIGSGVQRKNDGEKEILNELAARSKDEKREYKYGSKEVKDIAKELADENFSKTIDEPNFAENILQDLNTDIRKIFDNINNGQMSAINDMQTSINDKLAKKEFARSCFFGAIGILNAWAPLLASRAVSTIEQNIKTKVLHASPNLNITKIKLPVFAQNIKAFGESTMRSAVVSTISIFNSLIKNKPESVSNNIENINNKLCDLTEYSIHNLILNISQAYKDNQSDKVVLDGFTLGSLKAGIKIEVLKTIFPEYSQYLGENTITGISNHARNEFLTQIILNSGKIDKGSYFSDPSIIGNKNKQGGAMVEHALNALGGESVFSNQLSNPNEFAFASLNSSLSHMGLEINTTDEIKLKAKETNFLNQNRGFHLKVINEKSFKDFLADKEIVTDNHYYPMDGPIKEMKANYPSDYSVLFNSATSYMFNYDNVSLNDVRVWIHPTEYSSILDGKIKDIKSFTLKFLTYGNASVIKREASRNGRNFSSDGTYQLSGLNHIKVNF
ncbi:eCIS core domain-containing protein [Marinigracilibium pacificum]|uniref:DUF4157 domain-containing protein n=1 Tax=Marinigracilibium pacificum TaxID=2729599 RepID=A0A848J0A0_9BACT|nr:DUF4157 domain-containing protein [Marinigracilibium pacificum]NMM49081.1 DUF4157 domain-containing protein [Marinigracilibium pacificum]